MFWTFTLLLTAFALGIAACRRWPEDESLACLADLAAVPFHLAAQVIAKAKATQSPPAVTDTPTVEQTEKPAA